MPVLFSLAIHDALVEALFAFHENVCVVSSPHRTRPMVINAIQFEPSLLSPIVGHPLPPPLPKLTLNCFFSFFSFFFDVFFVFFSSFSFFPKRALSSMFERTGSSQPNSKNHLHMYARNQHSFKPPSVTILKKQSHTGTNLLVTCFVERTIKNNFGASFGDHSRVSKDTREINKNPHHFCLLVRGGVRRCTKQLLCACTTRLQTVCTLCLQAEVVPHDRDLLSFDDSPRVGAQTVNNPTFDPGMT